MADTTLKITLAGAAPESFEVRLLVENLLMRHVKVGGLPWMVVATEVVDPNEWQPGYDEGYRAWLRRGLPRCRGRSRPGGERR